MIGLVLSGGGARAAYQVGVLKGIARCCEDWGVEQPFPIISGTSAGAINAIYLASRADNYTDGVQTLEALWSELHASHVFHTDVFSLSGIGFRLIYELMTGKFSAKRRGLSLLDTSPLRGIVDSQVQFDQIAKNIKEGHLHSVAIKALNYNTGQAHAFFQGHDSIREWKRAGRAGVRTVLNANHIMASSAIPVLFPPVHLSDGAYGDGSLRNQTPLSPAIKMGAKKIVIVGVKRRAIQGIPPEEPPTLGRIVGITLNSVLLDSIDLDFERLMRINKTLSHAAPDPNYPLQPIEACMIRPSEDIGDIAVQEADKLPRLVRHLLRGLGSKDQSGDLISYLLFEPEFIRRLIDMGYNDALRRRDELESLFRGTSE